MNHAGSGGATLTVFYNGMVFSFDGISQKQAQSIILTAAASASGREVGLPAPKRPQPQLLQLLPPAAAESSQSAQLPTKPNFVSALPDGEQVYRRRPPIRPFLREVPLAREHMLPLAREHMLPLTRVHSLPLARANSIKRFLEARKKRLISKGASNSERKIDGVKANLDAKPDERLSLR